MTFVANFRLFSLIQRCLQVFVLILFINIVYFEGAVGQPVMITIDGTNFEITRELGRGTFGIVRLGRNLSTNEMVAIKFTALFEVDPSKPIDSFSAELFEMKKNRFQNLKLMHQRIFELFQTSQRPNKDLMLFFPRTLTDLSISSEIIPLHQQDVIAIVNYGVTVMPLSDKTVDDFLNSDHDVKERIALALKVHRDILSEISTLSEGSFAHFDIKPNNIGYSFKLRKFSLLDWDAVYGLPFRGLDFEGVAFTPYYGSPELVSSTGSVNATLYALGVTLLQILDPNFQNFFAKRWQNSETFSVKKEQLNHFIKAIDRKHSAQHGGQIRRITEFLSAAVTTNEVDRIDALLALELPTALRKALLVEHQTLLKKQQGRKFWSRLLPKKSKNLIWCTHLFR